jgi:hypothetical protein
MPVAAAVKLASTETVAGAAPQKGTLFFCEIIEKLRNVGNDRGIPPKWTTGRKQAVQNALTHVFKKKHEMPRQVHETSRTQKSHCDPAQKRTMLIAKT